MLFKTIGINGAAIGQDPAGLRIRNAADEEESVLQRHVEYRRGQGIRHPGVPAENAHGDEFILRAQALRMDDVVIPVAIQLKEAAKVQTGSAQPNRNKVGQVTWDQIREIAQDKMPDMNCFTVEAAMRMIAGTARSMGINVVGEFPNM